jgi:hypothetical protein
MTLLQHPTERGNVIALYFSCKKICIVTKTPEFPNNKVVYKLRGLSLSERFESLTQGGESQGAMEWLFRSSGSE